MQYLIHACPERMWYVNNFLLPSMQMQGIQNREILIWNDESGKGNLQSFVDSCRVCGEMKDQGVWHLQDDVLLCRDFAERTRPAKDRIVCGFCFPVNDPCVNFRGESIPAKFLWYSFQCIFIPNTLAGEFADWFENDVIFRERYRDQIADRRHDDWLFREFIRERHPDDRVDHLMPCLVEHIDYLIGGTVINKARSRKINRAVYWEDMALVDELARRLDDYRNQRA